MPSEETPPFSSARVLKPVSQIAVNDQAALEPSTFARSPMATEQARSGVRRLYGEEWLEGVVVHAQEGAYWLCARAISETLRFPIRFGFGLRVFGCILDLLIRV
ncbi:hypothetical protein ES332_D09G102700v1 [Gossypium tomentosum]|uniref:Uncharacterized protein n=1 Tax=Gossypium tomentosum TaxID=34277 RepID=A0A5D2JGE6_GOSTO|nr:hypothetical protein ES332_D09G102700v1 [Gossypium tomentosum]